MTALDVWRPTYVDTEENSDMQGALYNPAIPYERRPVLTDDPCPSSFASLGTEVRMTPDGPWRAYSYDELIARDKASLDIFWLRDESLSDSDNLPAPEVIAREIVEDLETALEQFREIAADLGEPVAGE
jgi:hypothetical protein